MIYFILRLLIAVLFISPYFILLSKYSIDFAIPNSEFLTILFNTIVQAMGSGAVSLIFGVLGGLGLLWVGRILDRKIYFLIENLLILPNLLPSLFVIVSCLGVLQPFPFGITGVVIIHSITNIGLISVLFRRICISKLGSISELCLVEGANAWNFFKAGVLGYLKFDLFYLFFYVFSLSLISFSAPYLVGGPTGANLEVLIFEKIVIDQKWSQALGLSFYQMLLIGLIGLTSKSLNWDWRSKRSGIQTIVLLEWKWGIVFPITALGVVIYSPLQSLQNGFRQLKFIEFNFSDLIIPLSNTLKVGLIGGLTLCVLSLVVCSIYNTKIIKFMSNYFISPGPVLLGFSFLLMQDFISEKVFFEETEGTLLLLSIGLSLLFFWSLFRLALASPLRVLSKQIEVAKVLGASDGLIFKKIIFPQMILPISFVCGLGSMWICGDFAFSKIITQSDFHFALIIKSLTSSYRIDAAQTLIFILYIISFSLYTFWWGLGHVFSRKFNIQE